MGELLMFTRKTSLIVLTITILAPVAAFAQPNDQNDIANNFNDLLHYLTISRLDLAKACATRILEGNPDPVVLLTLSSENPQSYDVLQKAKENQFDAELADLCGKVMATIDKGRFIRRRDPKVIVEEVKRLSTTPRGQLTAVKRLQDAGEYSIMFMLDALTDPARKEEWPNIALALPKIGRDAIRPLVAALQIDDVTIKAQIIETLAKMEYPHSLAFLKYIVETDKSEQIRRLATESINKIDPSALGIPSAQLFFKLAEDYYYRLESLSPAADANFANIWFWNAEKKSLERVEVDKSYFYELMTMRCCEWALKADSSFGQAIGLWLAGFFKAESTGLPMPGYFGSSHPGAFIYATTAGPEYLHQALERALKDKDSYVALPAIESLIKTAGEKSMLYRLGFAQPLLQALTYDDKMVRYSAAIAIATANPMRDFAESTLVTKNLAEAIVKIKDTNDPNSQPVQKLSPAVADDYAVRSLGAMLKLGQAKNSVINLAAAQEALVSATKDDRLPVRILAGQVLAYINSPNAQRAIAAMALDAANPKEVRIAAFNSLAASAKVNANLLDDSMVDAVFSLISSQSAAGGPAELKSAAAAAYGALNLPSKKVKDLILNQAKS
jgi:HEAT repeat protein